jgi:thiosulfate/3-mercaptopyruvate sulfurtransferase
MSVPLLVSTEWLTGRLGDPDVRIADVRWSLLEKDRGRNAYLQGHIPGAVFADVESDLAAPRGQGPGRHPLPRPESFAASMSLAGIDAGTHVIAHDFGDGSTAARLWWLLRYFGHERVSLLDGGIARWVAGGRPVESDPPSYPRGAFKAEPRNGMLVDADAVERLRGDPGTLILDSRMAERYEGKVEPIDPVAVHIPGARRAVSRQRVPPATTLPRARTPARAARRWRRSRRTRRLLRSGVNAPESLRAPTRGVRRRPVVRRLVERLVQRPGARDEHGTRAMMPGPSPARTTRGRGVRVPGSIVTLRDPARV